MGITLERVLKELIFVIVILFFLLALKDLYRTETANAQIEPWTDNLEVWAGRTSSFHAVKTLVNTENVPIDVEVSIFQVKNASFLKSYETYANGTLFVRIVNGTNIVSLNTTYNLLPSEILVFNVLVRTTDNVTTATSLSITKLVKIQETLVGDLDHNNVVNVYDCILMGKSLGINKDETGWFFYADLNKDNTINVYDCILLSSHLGFVRET